MYAIRSYYAAPSLAAAAEVSPSQVLREADQKVGTQYVPFRREPRDRQQPGEDKTLSPYFYVAGGDPETERLPVITSYSIHYTKLYETAMRAP